MMKHSQHDTNEEFKWDGDTLEVQGYRVEKTSTWYGVYTPYGTGFVVGDRRAAEMEIRQHMHEANMANPLYLDPFAKFVQEQPWNGFKWGRVNGVGGWYFGTELVGPRKLAYLANLIVNGEIDDPRREEKNWAQKVVSNWSPEKRNACASGYPAQQSAKHSVDANEKVDEVLGEMRDMGVDVDRFMKEKPEQPAPNPTEAPKCGTCGDYGIVPIPGGEPDDMAEPEPCPDCQPAPNTRTEDFVREVAGIYQRYGSNLNGDYSDEHQTTDRRTAGMAE